MPTTRILFQVGGVGLGTRVHENVEVVLRQNNVALHATRLANEGIYGVFEFLAEEAVGASFEAVVTLRSPFQRDPSGRVTPELLVPFDLHEVRQRFTLSRAGQPTPEPTPHPQVKFMPSVGTAASASVTLRFHTNLVDVTALYLTALRDRAARDLFHDVDAHVEVVDGKPTFKTDAFGGCIVRLLTVSRGDVLWVAIPPSLDTNSTRASMIRFLPDRDESYRDVFDVSLAATMRALASYGDSDRFRLPDSPTLPTLERDGYHGFSRPNGRGDGPFRVGELNADNYVNHQQDFPFLRICEQLANSGRKAVLVLPVPSGNITTSERVSHAANIRTGVGASVLEVLQGGGLVGRADGALVTLDKFILAAHGASGPYAIHEFDDNRDDFDELWLFDPDHIERSWHRLDRATNAKMRFVAGDAHPFLLERTANLGGAPPQPGVHTIPTSVGNITLWPRTATFWARSKSYALANQPRRWNAETNRIEPRDWTPSVMSAADVDRARRSREWTVFGHPISEAIGLVEVAAESTSTSSQLTIACVLANDSWSPDTTIEGCTMNEIAVGLVIGLGHRRASSARQFHRAIEEIVESAHIRRREWSVFGWQALSDGDEENEADYKSYFELCLHFSGIEQGSAPAAAPTSPTLPTPAPTESSTSDRGGTSFA